jgi:metal-sulfur cluster biosynthetic enzyme
MKNLTPESLEKSVYDTLKNVIDPETGADVLRMRLVEELVVDKGGNISYTFHPSSPLCPIAVFLVQEIKAAIAAVPGIGKQSITVTGYVAADELTKLINQ